jgi:hypothetical protein
VTEETVAEELMMMGDDSAMNIEESEETETVKEEEA